MPSAIPQINDATPVQVLPYLQKNGVTLLNNSSNNIYLRWDGSSDVGVSDNTPNSGFKLQPNASIDICKSYAEDTTPYNAIYAIAEPGSGSVNELRYFIR